MTNTARKFGGEQGSQCTQDAQGSGAATGSSRHLVTAMWEAGVAAWERGAGRERSCRLGEQASQFPEGRVGWASL